MTGYSIVRADDTKDAYADSDVPGEFRSLTDALGGEPVEMWAISRRSESDSGEKVDEFWGASPEAAQHE